MRVKLIIAVLCASACVSAGASAQEHLRRGTGEMPTVRDRFEGLGLRAGQFWVLPDIETGYFYDSNVFGESVGKNDDSSVYVSPSVLMRSDFGRHHLNLRAGLDHHEYFDFSSQSRTDFDGELDALLEISSDTVLKGGLKGGKFNQEPGDLEYPTVGVPTSPGEYYRFDSWASLRHAFNRLSVSVGAAFDYFNFDDVDGIDQDFRDGNVTTTGGRISYLASPGYRIFGDFRYNWRDYDGGTIADSDGWRALAGVEFEVTRLISGELGVGYNEQTYDIAGSPTTSSFSYHGALTWNPTPLMTVKLEADRTIEDSTFNQVGRVQDSAKLVVDYEVLRELIFTPSVGFSYNNYENSSVDDFRIEAGAELEYRVNRFMSVGSRYKYSYSDVTGPGLADWDRHLVGIYAKARF